MRGKIGLGFLVFALWSSSAAAEESAPGSSAPTTRHAASGGAVTVADGERRTTLVGFQALDHDAWLETNVLPDGTSEEWSVVCVAPCTHRVPRDGTFRAASSDFEASRPFRLPKDRERVIVTAQLGPMESKTGPILMTVLGWTSFGLIGPLVLTGGIINSKDALTLTGAVLTLGGAIVGTVGIVMLVTTPRGRRSHVSIARGDAPKLALPGGIGLDARGFTF